MTSCHIEADLYVDSEYLRGWKRVSVEFGDYSESIILGPEEASELAEHIDGMIPAEPVDRLCDEGVSIFRDGDLIETYPHGGWEVAVRINSVEVVLDRFDAEEFSRELKEAVE